MNTVGYGYTSFNDRRFEYGMNTWLGRTTYYTLHAPSVDQVVTSVMHSYETGYPTVVDEQERRGGPHFNNHSNSTFSHIMVVDSYDSSTGAVSFADPGYTLWGGAQAIFWYPSLYTFTRNHLQNEVINLHPQMSPRPRTPTRLNLRPTQITDNEPRTPGRTDPLHNPIQHGKSRIPLPIKSHSNGRNIHTHTTGCRKPLNQRRLHPIKNLLSRHTPRIHINSSLICSHIRFLRQGLSAGSKSSGDPSPACGCGRRVPAR